jgi:hypothetical protein
VAELVQRRNAVANPLVALALAASLFGGIAGAAVVAVTVPAVIDARAAAEAAEQAKWAEYGKDWEDRYRVIYPNSQ